VNANQSDFDPYVIVLSHERNSIIHPGDLEFDFQGGIMESLQSIITNAIIARQK
jgi:hypothetical protein